MRLDARRVWQQLLSPVQQSRRDHERLRARIEVWRRALERGWSVAGLLGGVPGEFSEFLIEPAFSMEETTFCLWRLYSGPSWQTGPIESLEGEDPDGSAELMQLLNGDPEVYRAWAESYFELPVARRAVVHIYDHLPLDEEVVTSLNPQLTLMDINGDASEIAYP